MHQRLKQYAMTIIICMLNSGIIMEHFELKYIPSYLIYNKEGEFVEKFTTFPGNEVVRNKILPLL